MDDSHDPFDVEYAPHPSVGSSPSQIAPPSRVVVEVDEDLEDLIPDFIDNRLNDIERMIYALDAGDFSTIQAGGHVMKGSGGGFGFDFVSEVGAELEALAKAADADGVRQRLDALREYLDAVEVVFV